jgi:flagellar assembly factor FliW
MNPFPSESTSGDGMTQITLQSARFGELDIPTDSIIEFPNGLIGIGGTRWALLARSEDSAFIWLHSIDDPELAVPVTNPWRFFSDYEVELSDDEAERIGIAGADQTSVYVTVRAAEQLEDFVANLRAPILIAEGRGYQVINQAGDAPMRAPLFAALATEAA